jgi:hypothetical protein
MRFKLPLCSLLATLVFAGSATAAGVRPYNEPLTPVSETAMTVSYQVEGTAEYSDLHVYREPGHEYERTIYHNIVPDELPNTYRLTDENIYGKSHVFEVCTHARSGEEINCVEAPYPPPAATWRGFTAFNPMPAAEGFWGPESFINKRPSGYKETENGKEIVKFVGKPETIWTNGGYDRPVYYASLTDPVLEVSGIKYGTWANGLKIHLPALAKPALEPCWPVTPTTCGGDHHLTVVEPNGTEYDFWEVQQIGSGKFVAGGAGYASNFGASSGVSEREAGSTASGFNNTTGVIRPEELAAENIHHALAGPVSFTRSGCHVGPAKGSDGTSGNIYSPCQGQLLKLEIPDAEINANSALPAWQKTILRALSDFGYRVDDSCGYACGFVIKIEAPVDRTAFGLANPFNTYLKNFGLTEVGGEASHGGPSYLLPVAEGVDWSRFKAIE